MGTAGDVLERTTSLSDALRRLWADHVIWTRQYIVAALAGGADAEAAAGRLLRNQEDIGNAVVPLYGEAAGARLTELLKDHILIAVDAIAAAIADDERLFRRLDRRWRENANDIAAFLAGANPNWPEQDLQDLLSQHLKLTKAELLARFNDDWTEDVERFDDIFTEILTMSDALAAGLVAQFPDQLGTTADAAAGLRAALRKLWTDHVIWTRQYIVAAVAGTPDAEASAGRLLRNQEDIGNAVVPLYGEAAGARLTELLKDHILIAVDLVAAAIKGDKRAFARHDKRWDDNADDIAAFLAGANPNWPEDDVRDLLAQHLSLTKGEAVARLQQDWAGDVAAFDDIFTEILTMADALTDGIVAQFPERFEAHEGSLQHAGGNGQGAAGAGRKTRFHSSLARA
jgi:hypothetical protein